MATTGTSNPENPQGQKQNAFAATTWSVKVHSAATVSTSPSTPAHCFDKLQGAIVTNTFASTLRRLHFFLNAALMFSISARRKRGTVCGWVYSV